MLAWIIYLTNPVLLWGTTLQHAGPPLEAQQGPFRLTQPGHVHHSTTIILKSYSIEPKGWETRTTWAHWRRALLVRCYSTPLSTGFNNLREHVLEQPWRGPELHLWDKLGYWVLRLNSYRLFGHLKGDTPGQPEHPQLPGSAQLTPFLRRAPTYRSITKKM